MSYMALLLLMPGMTSAAVPPGIAEGWMDGFGYANRIRLHDYHAAPVPGRPVIIMAHGSREPTRSRAGTPLIFQWNLSPCP